MKKITKNNLLKYIELKKEYLETKNESLLMIINQFTDEVINRDKRYYLKLSKYKFSKEELKFLM